MDPDRAAAERFLAGDRAAFDEIVARNQDAVYGTCLRLLGDPAEAEEAAQEVFVAAFRALSRFRWRSRLRTWLLRIAVNECRDRAAARRRRERPLPEPEPPPGTAAAAERSEMDGIVHAALAAVEPPFREVLVLRDIQGLDVAETADALGLPVGTVKSRLHRGRARLAELLRARLRPEDLEG